MCVFPSNRLRQNNKASYKFYFIHYKLFFQLSPQPTQSLNSAWQLQTSNGKLRNISNYSITFFHWTPTSKKNHTQMKTNVRMHLRVHTHGGRERERERKNPTKKRKWPLLSNLRISHFGSTWHSLSPSSWLGSNWSLPLKQHTMNSTQLSLNVPQDQNKKSTTSIHCTTMPL